MTLSTLRVGPFIKLGPLRNIPGVAERAGCLSGAGLVVILAVALTIYGASAFQNDAGAIGVKTLSGRELQRDPLQVCAPPLIPWFFFGFTMCLRRLDLRSDGLWHPCALTGAAAKVLGCSCCQRRACLLREGRTSVQQ